jgi:hypothetical protein
LKIEISHDTLAKTVYDKASAEDRMRLMVLNLIKTQHRFFNEQHAYLTSDELKIIAQFENQLDLSTEESGFLNRSKRRAESKVAFVRLSFVAVVFVLIYSVMYYKNTNDRLERVHSRLMVSKDSVNTVNNSLEIKFEELRVKDSIHESLTERIGNDQEIIKMTNKELQDALNQLGVLNQRLAEGKLRVEEERDHLKTDKRTLTERLKTQINNQDAIIKKRLSTVEQSQKLSQRAHTILNSSKNPTAAQYKESFQLARYAWEISNSNSQAMDVLNQVNNKKIKATNSGFLSEDRPTYTYSYRQIKRMIEKVDERYEYGTLSLKQVNRVLRKGS